MRGENNTNCVSISGHFSSEYSATGHTRGIRVLVEKVKVRWGKSRIDLPILTRTL
jgi:hypothetical protein